MRFFAGIISKFLSQTESDSDQRVQQVPKSSSGIKAGDIVFFVYKMSWRIVLVVSPVVKSQTSGRSLFTAFEIPRNSIELGQYTAESLTNLYKNKDLPVDSYKTFFLDKMGGPVMRIQ